MAAGDVTVEIVNLDTAAIVTAVEAMRVTANDKWMMASIERQVIIVHIEEA